MLFCPRLPPLARALLPLHLRQTGLLEAPLPAIVSRCICACRLLPHGRVWSLHRAHYELLHRLYCKTLSARGRIGGTLRAYMSVRILRIPHSSDKAQSAPILQAARAGGRKKAVLERYAGQAGYSMSALHL